MEKFSKINSINFVHYTPFSINEPELWRYFVAQPVDSQGMVRYVRSAVAARNSGKEFPFIIMDKI